VKKKKKKRRYLKLEQGGRYPLKRKKKVASRLCGVPIEEINHIPGGGKKYPIKTRENINRSVEFLSGKGEPFKERGNPS